MCGSAKAASSILVSRPARSLMASLSLSQRAKLAEVANRADDKRAAKEKIIEQKKLETEHNRSQKALNNQVFNNQVFNNKVLANKHREKEMRLARAKQNDIHANAHKENLLLRVIHWLDKQLAF
jgi:hypothetical protein